MRPAIRPADSAWADIGAGDGLFTRALARLLGPAGVVYAVDRDPDALRSLTALAASIPRDTHAEVVPGYDDFNGLLLLPPVDGVLLANVLHFVPSDRQASRVEEVVAMLKRGGRVVVIEYDRRAPSRWVPHPVSMKRLGELADEAGLADPVVTATQPSAYGGILYVAVLSRVTDP
jgi:SAM-dependent methyltransferase